MKIYDEHGEIQVEFQVRTPPISDNSIISSCGQFRRNNLFVLFELLRQSSKLFNSAAFIVSPAGIRRCEKETHRNKAVSIMRDPEEHFRSFRMTILLKVHFQNRPPTASRRHVTKTQMSVFLDCE